MKTYTEEDTFNRLRKWEHKKLNDTLLNAIKNIQPILSTPMLSITRL
jgi:hypothetical protein